MRILWVKAGKLLPVDTGGKLRSYKILKELGCDHDVRLLSFYGGQHSPEYEADLQREFPSCLSICTALPASNSIKESLSYLRRVFQETPFAVRKFTHPEVNWAIREWLKERSFDVAICDFLAPSLNFSEVFETPIILFQHNVETILWQRLASTESNPLKRIVYKIESAKMRRYESATLHRFDHIIAVSEIDRRQMLEMAPDCEISVVSTGADARNLKVQPAVECDNPKIAFIGSMDWEPNIDGVGYFCRKILPLIKSEFPTVVFQIVGRNPTSEVRRLASASVQVTGTVTSVDDYLCQATIVVVPLRIGGGTRLKIFEAMAKGKAVISTSIGAEGLEVENGRDLLLADDPVEFSRIVCQLLRDVPLRRKYEQAAIACVKQHDWSNVARRFEAVLKGTLEIRETARGTKQALAL